MKSNRDKEPLTMVFKYPLFQKHDLWLFRFVSPYNKKVCEILSQLKKGEHIYTQKYSDIICLDEVLVKVIKPQKAIDYFRKYWFLSQGAREFYSARTLSDLGIVVPEVYGYGFSIGVGCKYESVIFMEHKKLAKTGIDFLRSESNVNSRKVFITHVAKNIATIHKHNLYHKDTHFGNILVYNDHLEAPIWIDNDVKKMVGNSSSYIENTFKRFEKIKKNQVITDDEWEMLNTVYACEMQTVTARQISKG